MFSLSAIHLILFVLDPYTAPRARLNQTKAVLEYQDRGGRYAEGIKPEPVSGYDIELISVLVDYKDFTDHLPDQLRVRFYLPNQSEVNLIVRELDFQFYYWLDRVKPLTTTWRVGEQNEFDWPTGTVLRRLDETIDMYSLGVLIRLGKAMPAAVEDVAPAVLYHTKLPSVNAGYLFTMRTNGDARLSCSIYREGRIDPLMTQTFRRIPGGRSFTVPWNSSGSQEARYRLVCTGFFLDTNQPLEQTVRFYHKQTVR
jgi:hypothetical protein